jgi:RNA polymerase sigma factor FliA
MLSDRNNMHGDNAEQNLWSAWTIDKSARLREQLFTHYLPLAKSVAVRLYRNRSRDDVEFADHYQLACEGLLQAIDRYDVGRGVPFGGFAHHRIEGNIRSGIVKLTEAQQQILLRSRLRRERLQSLQVASNDAVKTPDALAMLCEVAIGLAVSFMLEDSAMLMQNNVIDTSPTAYDSLAWQQSKQQLLKSVNELPDLERRLINMHYGQDLDFGTIADVFKLSKGRISQLHSASLMRLRKKLKNAITDIKLDRRYL